MLNCNLLCNIYFSESCLLCVIVLTGVEAGVDGLDDAGLSGAGEWEGARTGAGAGVAVTGVGGGGTETTGVDTGATTGVGGAVCPEDGGAGVDNVETVSTTRIKMQAFGP